MYDEIDIANKANRCLNCKKPMCKIGCPISTSIPEFIAKVKEKDYKSAYELLQENNVMSEICSRICPVEQQCMSKCVRGIKENPVQINSLEKFINDWAKDNNIKYEYKIQNKIDRKVAIIGSGPAGIACSTELAKAGISDITIFEKEEKCGGILQYGIPDFRLSKDFVTNVEDKLNKLGIKIKNNVTFGKDITIEDLKNQGYTEIFVGTGATITNTYKLTDSETTSIYKADEFLKSYNTGKPVENLGKCVVIGGGNVALDSARVAARTTAKEVYILYRRNEELMPCCKSELEEVLEDGVKIIYQTKVTSANIENGKLKSVNCIKTKIENEKAVDIENSEFTFEADTVIFAIGSKIDNKFFESLGINLNNGLIEVNEGYKTSIENVYAGGDLVETKSSVCKAIATGKKAARAIINKIKEG